MSTLKLGRRSLLSVVLVAALLLSGLTSVALASSHGDAHTMLEAQGRVTAALTGNPDIGTFAQYYIAYPGNDTEIKIHVLPVYQDVTQARAFGFEVYGPHGLEADGVSLDGTSALGVTYSDSAAKELLVQVHNYSNNLVTFDVLVEGLPVTTAGTPAAAAPAPAPVVVTTTEQMTPAETDLGLADELEEGVASDLPTNRVLVGQSGGAFDSFQVTSTGDDRDIFVTLTFTVLDPSFGSVVGFNVYDPYGRLVDSGHQQDPGTHRMTFAAAEASPYTVQVYNYSPGIPVVYSLDVK